MAEPFKHLKQNSKNSLKENKTQYDFEFIKSDQNDFIDLLNK